MMPKTETSRNEAAEGRPQLPGKKTLSLRQNEEEKETWKRRRSI